MRDLRLSISEAHYTSLRQHLLPKNTEMEPEENPTPV